MVFFMEKRGNPPDGSVYHEGDPGPAAAPYRPAQPQNCPLRLALRPDLLFPEPQSGLCLYRRHLRNGSGYGPLQAPRWKPPVRHRYRRFPRHRALPDLLGLSIPTGDATCCWCPCSSAVSSFSFCCPDLLGRRGTARRGGCSACCCSPSARTTTSLTLLTACWTPAWGVAMSLLINGLLPRERLDAWQEKLGALRNRSEAGR